MTLLEARERAVEWIHAGTPGPVEVLAYDGVMDAAEIKRLKLAELDEKAPMVFVTVMGRDADRNILLCAYVAARMRTEPQRLEADDAGIEIVDAAEEALRTLLGAGRPLLEVRTQTLYDTRAERAGAVALWAVTVALPPLIGDAPASADQGLLRELDALLGQYLRWPWASTEPQRDRFLLGGQLPFALVTYGADSEVESAVGAYRYQADDGVTYERDRLGNRDVVAQVNLLGRTEEEVERELDDLLAAIPRYWTYEGLALPVHVRRVVGSHWRRKEGAHATVAEVRLQAAVPQGPPRVVETRMMQGRTQCGDGFEAAPADPPAVTTPGAGSGAAVGSIGVDREGRITSAQWSDRGSGYAAGDRLVFAQGAIFGKWTLRTIDVAAGALQDLAAIAITWVEDGRLRPDVQPEEDE